MTKLIIRILVVITTIFLLTGCEKSSIDVSIQTENERTSTAGCSGKFTVVNNSKEKLDDFYISFDEGVSTQVFASALRIGEEYSNEFFLRRSSCEDIKKLPRQIKCSLAQHDCEKDVIVRFKN